MSAADSRTPKQMITPDKKNIAISLADRAARIHNDLPEIEEMADKENDTFAQGGPLKALNKIAKNPSLKNIERKERERSHLRSAENNQKYRMYRESSE